MVLIAMKPIEIAFKQIGVKEIKGDKDNPEVLKYFNDIGFDGARLKDETAWCSAFVNWCCKYAGCEYSGKLNARSWLEVGSQVDVPLVGDLVILWREDPESWKGHVGFYMNDDEDFIYILGGNQANAVRVSQYPKNQLIEYRRVEHR